MSVGPLLAASFVPERHCADLESLRHALPQEIERIAFVWDGINLGLGRAVQSFAQEFAQRGAKVRTYITGEFANGRGAELMGMHPRFAPRYADASHQGHDLQGIVAAARERRISVLSILGADPVLRSPEGPALAEVLTHVHSSW